jgi:hypothetical protein
MGGKRGIQSDFDDVKLRCRVVVVRTQQRHGTASASRLILLYPHGCSLPFVRGLSFVLRLCKGRSTHIPAPDTHQLKHATGLARL